jgi:hypothetical protein
MTLKVWTHYHFFWNLRLVLKIITDLNIKAMRQLKSPPAIQMQYPIRQLLGMEILGRHEWISVNRFDALVLSLVP